MKTNIVLFLIATLVFSSMSIIMMVKNLDSTNPLAKQCRIQSDISPADFNFEVIPEKSENQSTCGIFGDIKPKDWDEWYEDSQASNG